MEVAPHKKSNGSFSFLLLRIMNDGSFKISHLPGSVGTFVKNRTCLHQFNVGSPIREVPLVFTKKQLLDEDLALSSNRDFIKELLTNLTGVYS